MMGGALAHWSWGAHQFRFFFFESVQKVLKQSQKCCPCINQTCSVHPGSMSSPVMNFFETRVAKCRFFFNCFEKFKTFSEVSLMHQRACSSAEAARVVSGVPGTIFRKMSFFFFENLPKVFKRSQNCVLCINKANTSVETSWSLCGFQ